MLRSFLKFSVLFLLILSVGACAQETKTIRLGIAPIDNKAKVPIDQRLQRDRYLHEFRPNKKRKEGVAIEAVLLDGKTRLEIEREAKEQNCDYILYTTVVDLGLQYAFHPAPEYGRHGVAAAGSRCDAIVDFQLYRRGDPEPFVSSSLKGSENALQDETVSRVLDQIVSRVRRELTGRN